MLKLDDADRRLSSVEAWNDVV